MDTLKEASIIITIAAPIQSAGSIAVNNPELGNIIKATDDKIAPTKK
jgi:hypothetical protein